jgi:type IV pilus assembly protein PilY1
MRAAALIGALVFGIASGACAAPPPLAVPDRPLETAGRRVPPNLLLNLSLTFADAGAAYRGDYVPATAYAGYFNPRMCYSYPMKRRSASVQEPDPDERGGHFSVLEPAGAQHECGGDSFSGNLLNWASASTLDLLRYALTGGDRVIDEPGLTVLQRAWLPDGVFHPDFYAHPLHFPRKTVGAPRSVTPFDGAALHIVSCRNRILFSHTKNGTRCDAPRYGASGRRLVSDKHLGEYNARVSVCDAADSALRPDLCTPREGGFKPEGSLQAHSDALRIGVMSYLTGHGKDDPNLYGGVLRAPLKFIGANAAQAPGFVRAANAYAEWHPATGVLHKNPDRSAGAASGAINYINLLGRSGPEPGAYKSADPGAELFYESLRYLQGRQASAGAGDAAADDGLPVWIARTDPVSAACQRNVVATVGHPSFVDDRYLPGNTRTDTKDSPRAADSFAPAGFNVMQSTRRIGELEASAPGAARPDLAHLDALSDGAGGEGSYYLAGAAYWAHTNAIRPDPGIRVDSLALELGAPAKPRSSALYLAAKYGAFDDRNGDANPFVTLPGHAAGSEWRTGGATPAGFFAGDDAHAIIPAVRALFAAARAGTGELAGRAAGGAGYLIQASYRLAHASGSVRRIALTLGAGGTVSIGASPVWDAAALLTGDPHASPPVAPRPSPAARKIYTLLAGADKRAATVAFKWDQLSPSQRALFDIGGDGLGEARVEFLRGERTREAGQPGGVFRRRAGVLGDTINSTPLLVGAPSASVQGAGYGEFHRRAKARRSAVYVGANDGMLHAFDAADGAELFAYVPNALMPELHRLSSPDYPHRPFADGSPGHGEASLGGKWRTVLVSGMGMGARGVFALDITDPAAFDAGLGALWEFTDKDDPAIGHVRAPPLIASFKVGMKGLVPELRYFAVVSSGWNNDAADGKSGDAGGALFLLALDKPVSERWKQGLNYYKLATPLSGPGLPNALAAPALALAANGSVRYAYAGDLQGRLWRFDFSGKPPWASAAGTGAGPEPLFVARDAAGQRQPFTHAPRVVFAPGGGYLILAGTGKFIEESDLLPENFASQSLYAVHDRADGPPTAVQGRGELARRTLSGTSSHAVSGDELRLAGPGAKKGWYLDFPRSREDGERAAGSAIVVSGALLLDTIAPGADPCAAPASRSYVLDALSGFAFNADGVAQAGAATGEITQGEGGTQPLVFDISMAIGPRNPTGGAIATRTVSVVRLRGGGKTPVAAPVSVAVPARRVSWREVANWQELHEAAKK